MWVRVPRYTEIVVVHVLEPSLKEIDNYNKKKYVICVCPFMVLSCLRDAICAAYILKFTARFFHFYNFHLLSSEIFYILVSSILLYSLPPALTDEQIDQQKSHGRASETFHEN